MGYVEKITGYGETAFSHITEFSIATAAVVLTIAALFAFTLRYGASRIIALILSIYVGLLVYLHFPYTERLLLFKGSDFNVLLSNAIIYIGFVLLIYIAINRLIWADDSEGGKRFLQALVLSFSASALLLAFAYNILPIASFYPIEPTIERFFSSTQFFFWWLILPLIGILFFARR